MNGVEILTSLQVVTEHTFNLTAFWFIGAIFVAAGIVAGIIDYLKHREILALVCYIVLGIFIGLLFGVTSGTFSATPSAYETQYKVTISDEVSMNDFYEHYEVIDQDGKIFTVRERDNNE
jgi:energy-coupling factor transporter transmembrane protein EcfT